MYLGCSCDYGVLGIMDSMWLARACFSVSKHIQNRANVFSIGLCLLQCSRSQMEYQFLYLYPLCVTKYLLT